MGQLISAQTQSPPAVSSSWRKISMQDFQSFYSVILSGVFSGDLHGIFKSFLLDGVHVSVFSS